MSRYATHRFFLRFIKKRSSNWLGIDLQAQVRDTTFSESHLERVQVLEEAFAEQEVMKRGVKAFWED